MGLFNPTERELQALGINRSIYFDNWFHLSKFSGMARWNKCYTFVFYISNNLTIITMFGFIIGAALEGHRAGMMDGLQNLLIVTIMFSGCAAFHFYHDEYLYIFQALNGSAFFHEGLLDQKTEKDIIKAKTEARDRKQIFKNIVRVVLVCLLSGLLAKKPAGYLIRGKGIKPVDGENNLIWNGPFGMYMPFANYWASYLIGMAYGHLFILYITIAGIGYVTAFQFISEELASEFEIVAITLSSCVVRAEILYKSRFQDINSYHQMKPEGKVKDEVFDDCLKKCVNAALRHHHETVRIFNMFKQIMFVPLFLFIVSWAVITCISVYLILDEDVSMDFKLPIPPLIAAECIVALLFCYYGELLTNMGEDVGDSIYQSENWWKHGKTLKPYASILKSYCNIRHSLSAGGFFDVNHETFLNLISKAYSYMGFLLST